MKKFCIGCGKYYRDLPCQGRGVYYGFRVCKTCGRPTEEEVEKMKEEDNSLQKKETE